MKEGYCQYGFPKPYVSATELSEDGFPLYRRRSPEEGGNSCVKYRNGSRVTYTNEDVVPYNKYLLYKYNCHINVEYCHSIQAIKYLFKYINKGMDEAQVTVETKTCTDADETGQIQEQHRNEVQEFQNKRYVSGAEACWRLRENEIAEHKPVVNRLQIHLKGEQTVYFDASDKDQSIKRIERSEQTKLTAFFELNRNIKNSKKRKLLYREVPEYYTWDQSAKEWKERKRGGLDGIPDSIGRLYSIHPAQVQLYALRLLLNHVRGPTSFEDIRTVDGVLHDSFQDAAVALELVKDDTMWIECMREANDSQTNIHLLRKLFVSILLRCEVSNHKLFYEKCKDILRGDYLHKYNKEFKRHPVLKRYISDCKDEEQVDLGVHTPPPDDSRAWTVESVAENSALCDIENMLSEEDKSLKYFGLPLAEIHMNHYIWNFRVDKYISEGEDFSPDKAKLYFEANFIKLNKD